MGPWRAAQVVTRWAVRSCGGGAVPVGKHRVIFRRKSHVLIHSENDSGLWAASSPGAPGRGVSTGRWGPPPSPPSEAETRIYRRASLRVPQRQLLTSRLVLSFERRFFLSFSLNI